MICKFVIVGTIHEAPQRIDEHSIVFRVSSRVGTFDRRPIIVTVTAHDDLAERFADLKRGAQVMVDGEPKTTRQGNPILHSYSDGKPYALYEVTAKNILKIKSLV